MRGFYKIQYYLIIIIASFSACKNRNSTEEPKKAAADSLGISHADTAISINLENPVASQKILLRFQPPVSSTYYFNNNSSYTATRRMDTLEMKALSSKFVKMKMTVESIEKGNTKINFVLLDVKKTIKDDSATVNYQSGQAMTDPGQDIDRQLEDCLVNSPIILSMNEKGEVADMQGYENIIAKMKTILEKATGKSVPDEYIAQQMSLPTENIDNLFIVFPDTAVQIGETWQYVANSALQGMPIVITSKYTLADRKDGIAYINLSAAISIDKSQLTKEILDQMTNLKVTSYMNGTLQVDEKTGWPQQMKLSQFVEIKDSYQGQSTYSKETGSTTISLIR